MTVCACLLWAIGPAFALDPSLKIAQYHHTSWVGKEGAPTEVTSIVEAPDGFLWLATPDGLVQFDGTSFERIDTLGGDASFGSEPIRTLCADATGGVWLGFGQDRGAALYKGGKLLRFKGRSVTRCAQVDDVTWLVSNFRLARYVDGRIEDVGSEWGLPAIVTRFVVVDQNKTVWAFDAKGYSVWYLLRGEKTFRSFRTPEAIPALANVAAPDGSIWGAASPGFTEISVAAGRPVQTRWLSHKNLSLMLFDRDGGFWATDVDGLVHVGDPGRIRAEPDGPWRTDDVMTVERGLSSDVIWSMVEDKKGNIWLGTGAGLERYRDSAVVPIRLPGRSLAFSVAPAGDGSVWAANWTSDVMKVDRRSTIQTFRLDPVQRPPLNNNGFFTDTDGSVLAAAPGVLWRLTPKGAVRLTPLPPDMTGMTIQWAARDAAGVLWVAAGRSGPVVTLRDGVWSKPSGRGLPDRWNANALVADHRGRIWASQHASVLLVENGEGTTLDKASNGLDVGEVQVLFSRGTDARVWVGGSSGVSAFDGERFHTLRVLGDAVLEQVTGIVEARNGDLWIHGRTDGFRIEASELKRFYADPSVMVVARRFGALDGLNGSTRLETSKPNLIEGSDGLIWFASTAGIGFFDPSRDDKAPPPPTARVQAISTGGVRWPLAQEILSLPALSKHIEVSYTAIELRMPERIRFKYRLDGIDTAWRESGTRRVAAYDDLPPGDYRFHVLASDERGAWGHDEAIANFRIPPAWFQTWTFRLLAALALGALVWFAYRTRVAQLTARVRWQLRTQQTERDRIARDLHDTLLQGVQGLIWRFHTLLTHLTKDDPIRVGMESALDSAEVILAQSRDRVQDLRGVALPQGFAERLREIGDSLSIDQPASFQMEVRGTPREIDSTVQSEVSFIVREALSNAFVHSGATAVTMLITFGDKSFDVEVRDDGVGIDPDVLDSGKEHHFGLAVMRERAAGLGAAFSLSSSRSSGTQLQLSLKATIAYRPSTAGK